MQRKREKERERERESSIARFFSRQGYNSEKRPRPRILVRSLHKVQVGPRSGSPAAADRAFLAGLRNVDRRHAGMTSEKGDSRLADG